MAATEKRCYYEVLGLRQDCSPDEIRSSYKKLALQLHPDKLIKSGLSQSEATAKFQELVNAYEVLSDPKERAWYDSHRSQILFSDPNSNNSSSSPIPNLFSFFSNTVFSGYSDTGKGFYKVYSDLFDKIYRSELSYVRKLGLGIDVVKEAPLMGNLESPYEQVTAFYNYWLGFSTVMDFGWVDMYDAAAGVNRKSRRVMEEENKKLRKKARREFNETVRGLAEFVKKRDKRVVDMMVKRNMENEKRKEEERERKKKLERERLERVKAYEEPEWAKVDQEEEVEMGFGDEGEEERKDEGKQLYCVVCSKKFKSEKQWENHEKSKKHKEKVEALRESFVQQDENDGLEDGYEGVEELSENGAEEIGRKVEEDLNIRGHGDDDEEEEEEETVVDGVEGKEESENEGELDGEESLVEIDEDDLIKDAKDATRTSGGDDNDSDVDEISVLEAMLSGRKNRRKMASVETFSNFQNGAEKTEFMEYDNRKINKKNHGGKKDRRKKATAVPDISDDEVANQHEDTNGLSNSNMDDSFFHSILKNENKVKGEDGFVGNNKKATRKADPNVKLKNSSKGRKSKGASKNVDNICESCGEEFDSRNKLHKHLGETGHATLKFRR